MNPGEIWLGDIGSRSALNGIKESLEGAETLVYLASVTTPYVSELRPELEATNFLTAQNYFSAAITSGVRRIILVSSGGTIYRPSSELRLEGDPITPSCFYGVGKYAIELLAARYAARRDFELCILRFSNVYGPYQTARGGQGLIAAVINAAVNGEKLTLFGDATRDYLFVNDACDAVIKAVDALGETINGQEFNISAGSGTRSSEIVAIIGRLFNRDILVKQEPPRDFDLESVVLSNKKAAEVLGWKPRTSIEKGIEAMLPTEVRP